jgi:surfactin synthase thioesterase subunit
VHRGLTLSYQTPFVRIARRPAAKARLLCFPHAGAGISAYRDWPPLLSSDIEVVALQLPGREDRIHDTPFTHAEPMVRSVVQAIRPFLGLPMVFMGHSGGALLAYETCRALARRASAEPLHLFLSGQAAPGHGPVEQFHKLPDALLLQRVRELGGTSNELLADGAAGQVLLPILRADFMAWETYRFPAPTAMSTPIDVFGGEQDARADAPSLAAWRDWTTGAFDMRMFPGDHFFINHARDAVAQRIEQVVSMWMDSGKRYATTLDTQPRMLM